MAKASTAWAPIARDGQGSSSGSGLPTVTPSETYGVVFFPSVVLGQFGSSLTMAP